MDERKIKGKLHCRKCNKGKTIENTFIQRHNVYGFRWASYCKSCELAMKKDKRKQMKKENRISKKYKTTKVWEKTNKNHYPDQDWVWQQLETPGINVAEAIEKKYHLKSHGNEGNPGNRWINRNKNKNK